MFVGFKKQAELEEDIVTFGLACRRENWLIAVDFCQEWVESMLSLVRNKQPFYQKGLRAIKLIGQALCRPLKSSGPDGVTTPSKHRSNKGHSP